MIPLFLTFLKLTHNIHDIEEGYPERKDEFCGKQTKLEGSSYLGQEWQVFLFFFSFFFKILEDRDRVDPLYDPHCRRVCKHWWRVGARTHDHPCRTQQARRRNRFVHIPDCASNGRPALYTWQTVAATKISPSKIEHFTNYIDRFVKWLQHRVSYIDFIRIFYCRKGKI